MTIVKEAIRHLPVGSPVDLCQEHPFIGELQPVLLKAGFARGDQEYLVLAVDGIVRLASGMRW